MMDLYAKNKELRDKSPGEIIDWALALTQNRIVTTSFGVYSAVLLSTFFQKDKDIKVIWCDTGYNTPETYGHSSYLIRKFGLNIHKYMPVRPKRDTDMLFSSIKEVGDAHHQKFTEVVKLEPFRRALDEHQPELWFTNIRVRQTAYRSSKDILSLSKDGVLKVSPFYYWSDEGLDRYLHENALPKNTFYFDPVKVFSDRECGIHLQ